MLLAQLVETSRRVTDTSRRLEKIDLLAALLRQARADEIETVTAFLSGRPRQNRIGIGYAALRDSQTAPTDLAGLELIDIDRTLDALATASGPGSERQKRDLLQNLFARRLTCAALPNWPSGVGQDLPEPPSCALTTWVQLRSSTPSGRSFLEPRL